jgi:glycosyltransferase involved in cell wall biosynthesis
LKVALVTTSPSIPSGIGDYTRHLLPALGQHLQLELFHEPGSPECEQAGLRSRPASALVPAQFERVLYQLGNMGAHAFMLPLLKRFGGVVMQHDWVLFDLAVAAHPGLTRGGTKGALLAAREGGPSQLKTYLQSFLARRRGRLVAPALPAALPAEAQDTGELIFGWHEPEPQGRWIADQAFVRMPEPRPASVAILVSSRPGRRLELFQGDRPVARFDCTKERPWVELRGDLDPQGERLLRLAVEPVTVTPEQRRFGDTRRLGAHVERIRWLYPAGWPTHAPGPQGTGRAPLGPAAPQPAAEAHGGLATDDQGSFLDQNLSEPAAIRLRSPSLSDARFELPLNRSVVRNADGFLCHSRYVAERIQRLRGGSVPIGLVHHGAERRWSEQPRAQVRRELGLPEAWEDCFLLVSFGGVQAHKRIDKVLAGLREARERRRGIHLVMVGALETEGFDARAAASRLGLGDAVHFRGYAPEAEVWKWLHASDVGINLRGPTSGGTSGGIFQTLGLGRPVIVSDAAEQSELPNDCTLKVPLGPNEVPVLANTLVRLHDDPSWRQALELAARRFVDQECHWSHCAKRYAEHLARMPALRPRS